MIFLYVIKSEVNGDLYTGICKDIDRRLKEHEQGKNRYTKGLRPWKLVLTEKYENWSKAREKEIFYKSGFGKEKLKAILAP
jgi:predicted GIY-YIG superfamily endonuclease